MAYRFFYVLYFQKTATFAHYYTSLTSYFMRLFLFSLCFIAGSCAGAQKVALPDPGIQVRKGYELTIVQDEIKNPRMMQVGDQGELYVSLPGPGEIVCCHDKDGDGYFETKATFVSGHRTVHGMCFYKGWLWFTETGAIFCARDTNGDGKADEEKTIIPEGKLPRGEGHWWRSILLHNDRIYTSIGDGGNIEDQTKTERQKIWTFKMDGSDKKLFASGLRNTEKLVNRPGTDEIWGMDHGSDWFGKTLGETEGNQPVTDINPPCEMNHYRQDGFYGHPFITGNRIPRYEYVNRKDIVQLAAQTTPPAWCAGGHWAPNSMTFYTGTQFPAEVHGDAFVSYHGSWNRTAPAGYCVTRVLFEDGKPYGELKYVNFLSADGKVLGRPVDTAVAPDGSLLISDDGENKIYRLRAIR
jgi:glucose/arabinose dehydrogenase